MLAHPTPKPSHLQDQISKQSHIEKAETVRCESSTPTKRWNESQGGPQEIVEGRPLTKKNTEESNSTRTPSRANEPSRLDRGLQVGTVCASSRRPGSVRGAGGNLCPYGDPKDDARFNAVKRKNNPKITLNNAKNNARITLNNLNVCGLCVVF